MRRLLLWTAVVVLVLLGIALGVGIGVWVSSLHRDEAVEAGEIVAIVALAVFLFAHDHPRPPDTRR